MVVVHELFEEEMKAKLEDRVQELAAQAYFIVTEMDYVRHGQLFLFGRPKKKKKGLLRVGHTLKKISNI